MSLGFLSDGRHLFGHVDPHRAPGDAPATTDAPGTAKLRFPGPELVRQPLPVALLGCGPEVPAVDHGVIQGEAGVPEPLTILVPVHESARLPDAEAETGRANVRAIPARKAAFGQSLPTGVVDVTEEDPSEPFRIDLPTHSRPGHLDGHL